MYVKPEKNIFKRARYLSNANNMSFAAALEKIASTDQEFHPAIFRIMFPSGYPYFASTPMIRRWAKRIGEIATRMPDIEKETIIPGVPQYLLPHDVAKKLETMASSTEFCTPPNYVTDTLFSKSQTVGKEIKAALNKHAKVQKFEVLISPVIEQPTPVLISLQGNPLFRVNRGQYLSKLTLRVRRDWLCQPIKVIGGKFASIVHSIEHREYNVDGLGIDVYKANLIRLKNINHKFRDYKDKAEEKWVAIMRNNPEVVSVSNTKPRAISGLKMKIAKNVEAKL